MTRGEAWRQLQRAREALNNARDDFVSTPCEKYEKAFNKADKAYQRAHKVWRKFNS